jgi:hypothetical protein
MKAMSPEEQARRAQHVENTIAKTRSRRDSQLFCL